MKRVIKVLFVLFVFVITSCKDDGLSKDDITEAIESGNKDLVSAIEKGNADRSKGEEIIEDEGLEGKWIATVNDENGDAVSVEYVFNEDKTYKVSTTGVKLSESKKGTFYVISSYRQGNAIVTITKVSRDSYSKKYTDYKIVEGKLHLEEKNIAQGDLIVFTKKE